MIHFVHSYLHKDMHPITIDIIGCGGTGSHVLTRLARMHHVLVQLGFKGLLVRAWDFDIVEENNVGRQSFTENDIGKNKAKCLINKINIAFGTAWISKGIKYNLPKIKSNILITCVDNTETRNSIQKKFRNRKKIMNVSETSSFYWIDCGNGKDFGQVVIGSLNIPQPKSKHKTVSKLETIIEKFGNLKEFETEEIQGMESCSLEASLSKQDLFINDLIAVHACDIIWKMLRHKYLEVNGCIVNLQKINSKGFYLSLS